MFVPFTRIVYTIFSSRATGIFVIAKDFRFSTQAPGYHFPRRNYHRHTLPSCGYLISQFRDAAEHTKNYKSIVPD